MKKRWMVVNMADTNSGKTLYYTVICEEGDKMYGIGEGNEPMKFKTRSEGKRWISENKDREVWMK